MAFCTSHPLRHALSHRDGNAVSRRPRTPPLGRRPSVTKSLYFAKSHHHQASPPVVVHSELEDKETSGTDSTNSPRLANSDLPLMHTQPHGQLPNFLNFYDPVAIADYYRPRPLAVAFRFLSVLFPFAFWHIRANVLPKWAPLSEKSVARSAARLRQLIAWAGPTALKLGQAVSSRPDVVGPVYMAELQKLTDDVGPFDWNTAEQILREELAVSDLMQLFDQFDPVPVASASLGQVHRAVLRRSGQQVAVKIQRPKIKELASLDLYILRMLAAFLKNRLRLRSDLVGIVDEFGTQLWREVDYNLEAQNTEDFRKYYAFGRVPGVYVPKVYRAYSTRRILTTEWIDGDKPPWYPVEDAEKLISIGVNCSLDQLFGDHGLVHGDPHAGNLFRRVSSSSSTGRELQLVWLDFGMCIRVDRRTREDLICAITHLINRNFDGLAVDFQRLGFLLDGADATLLVPKLQKAFADAGDSTNAVSGLSFGKLANNLAELASTSPIRIPVALSILIRSLTILEGLALQSNRSFKIVDAAYPYVVRRLLESDSPALQEALRDVLVDANGRLRWNRLESVLKASDGRGQRPIGIAGTGEDKARWQGVQSNGNMRSEDVSKASQRRMLSFLLSSRGAFLREALTREVTEIVDAVQLESLSRIAAFSGGPVPQSPGVTLDRTAKRRLEWLFRMLTRSESSIARNPRVADELLHAIRVVTGEISDRNAKRTVRLIGQCLIDAMMNQSSSATQPSKNLL